MRDTPAEINSGYCFETGNHQEQDMGRIVTTVNIQNLTSEEKSKN